MTVSLLLTFIALLLTIWHLATGRNVLGVAVLLLCVALLL